MIGLVHALDRHAARLTPAVPFLQVDLRVVPPFDEPVRPVGDDVRRLGPLVAPALDNGSGHGEEHVVGEQVREPGLGLPERDADRPLVERLDPDPVAEALAVALARVVGKRALDPVHDVGVASCELRVELALPRVLEVLGGDRPAVRPASSVAQKDRVDLSAAADRPARRQVGHGLQRPTVETHERIHEVVRHLRGERVGADLRIQGRRLTRQGDDDRLRVLRRARARSDQRNQE